MGKVNGIQSELLQGGAGVNKEDQKRFPVEMVSWEDAQSFLGLLNDKEKEAGWKYRLPKEWNGNMPVEEGRCPTDLESAFDFYLDKPTNQITAGAGEFRGW